MGPDASVVSGKQIIGRPGAMEHVSKKKIFLTFLSWLFSSRQEERKERKKKKPSRYCFFKERITIIKCIKIKLSFKIKGIKIK